MKKVRLFLKLFFFAQLGACVGRVVVNCIDYLQHPAIYEIQSAPWYTASLITALLTAVTAAITAVAYILIGRIIRKREGES